MYSIVTVMADDVDINHICLSIHSSIRPSGMSTPEKTGAPSGPEIDG